MGGIGKALAVSTVLLLPGCGTVSGIFGGDEPEACVVERRDAGDIAGAYLRRPQGNPTFTALPVSGSLRRDGTLRRISIDDTRVRMSAANASGEQSGRRRASAAPLTTVDTVSDAARAMTFTYTEKGVAFQGGLAYGALPAVSSLPGTGRQVFEGRVEMTLLGDPAGNAPDGRSASGRISIVLGYASRRAAVRVDTISGAGAVSQITWENLSLCGARLASAGQGRTEIRDSAGAQLSPVGASDAGAAGTAVFDSSLVAAMRDGSGGPAALAGVLLFQGDSGTIGGVFVADAK